LISREFGYYSRQAVKPFLDDNFLLTNDTAVRLYHEYAKAEPIIDYHCHLPPAEVASNHRFKSLTEIWLNGDHYKWRALRSNGVAERLITGDASDWEKFEAWAKTVPHTLRNPLYHWTHLELRNPFGVKGKVLNGSTAREIYDHCNELLKKDEFTTQGLLKHFKVEVVCTTDDPIDSLEHHATHAKNPKAATKLYPTWRPDKSLFVHDLTFWNEWIGKLEAASGVSINSYTTMLEALKKRHDVFHAHG
jgi:glucuronate isomerase